MNTIAKSRISTKRRIRIGSEEHKELFCREFLDTFEPYKPAVIPWPVLDDAALGRLTGLPFWSLAVQTEIRASFYMQAFADREEDPLIREAISLNAFEETRHKEVLGHMIAFYGIKTEPEHGYRPPEDVELVYLQTGYGECFDSFFSFGLFRLTQDSNFLPAELIEVFEPIIQEEARHILFFVNWAAYTQARRPLWRRPQFIARRAGALAGRVRNRLSSTLSAGKKSPSFSISQTYLKLVRRGYDQRKERRGLAGNGSESTQESRSRSMGGISPRAFLELCLAENERRMARYDPRLVRPQFVPRLVRPMRFLLGRAT